MACTSDNMASLIIKMFEPKYQQEASDLYRNGINSYQHTGSCHALSSSRFTKRLTPGGDIYDIDAYFMKGRADNGKKRCFWVALLDDKVVGIVGAVPSTKFGDDYLELVRMSVSATCRKCGVGSRLLATIEAWAKEQGYSRMNLYTLDKFTLAVDLYMKNGYALHSTVVYDVTDELQLNKPEFVNIVHFVKVL